MDKYKLAEWYVDSIRQVTNKNNVINSHIDDKLTIYEYLKNSKYRFLNELWEVIKPYNAGEKERYRKILLEKLTYCARNKFIYNDVIRVIYDNLLKLRAVHCNWKEVIHVIKDKEIDYLLTKLWEKNYKLCYSYLTGDYVKQYEENKENNSIIKLDIINKIGELINLPPLTMEEYIKCKNKTDTDKVYISKKNRKILKELGINDINKFVNEYIRNYINNGGF